MQTLRILLLTSAAAVAPAADIRLVDEIVAKVNGDIITRSDIERDRKTIEGELRQQGLTGQRLADALQEAEKNLLRERIDRLVLQQKGKELNINVDSELSKYLADIQRRAKIADPEKFQQYVRDQTGQPFEDFKNETKNGMLQQRVIRQEVSSKVNIKREEQHKYYDEHKDEFMRQERVFLREILVSTEGKDATGVAASDKKAKDLVARARKGEKFPEIAQSNSDAVTAEQGGDIGPWEKDKLRKELADLVWDKPRGYVTDPWKVDNGFYILKVDEHQKAGLAQFEEVENEVMEKLFLPRMQPEVRKYLTKLRVDAFLEIKPGYLDSGAAPGKNTAWTDPAQLKPETVTKAQVAAQTRRKKLLWAVPIPGTRSQKTGTSSSR